MLRNIAVIAVCAAACTFSVFAQPIIIACPALPAAINAAAAKSDTLSLLKVALANEWLNSAPNAILALKILTVGIPETRVADELMAAKRRVENLIALDPGNKSVYQNALRELSKIAPAEAPGNAFDAREPARQAFQELIAGDAANEELYRFGLGDVQSEGTPDYAGISDFLDDLSEANTLNFKAPDNESDLFKSVKSLLNLIATKSPRGRLDLKVVQDSFTRKDKHVALYQLLSAVPSDLGGCKYSYPKVLEIFRAAYAMKWDELAEAVAATNAPAQ